MNEYSCHGFHQSLTKGRASGTVSVSDDGIFFQFSAQRKKIPFDGTRIRLGGASNRLVFFKHPSLSDWDIYTNDRSILNDQILKTHPHLFEQLKRAKNKRLSGWLTLTAMLLILVTLPILAISKMGGLSARLAEQIPSEWERKLGGSAIAQMQVSQSFLPKNDFSILLEPLTAPLVNALNSSRYSFEFYIVENATPNAFALPGGFVVIHSGLLQKAKNAEELLGVLAHELTHISQQHGLRSLIGSTSLYLVVSALLGDASGLLATLSTAAPAFINQGYSRDYEREADKAGFELMKAANVDPKGLASFFQMLLDEENKKLATIENEDTRKMLEATMGFLSTHPATQERIDYLTGLSPAYPTEFLNLKDEFLALQAAVIQAIATHENEESLDAI